MRVSLFETSNCSLLRYRLTLLIPSLAARRVFLIPVTFARLIVIEFLVSRFLVNPQSESLCGSCHCLIFPGLIGFLLPRFPDIKGRESL